jgi:two-component system phosphate regulon response regulator PhoB
MAQPHILVIEDEEDIQTLIDYNLTKAGYRVTCTPSGEQGIRLAEAAPPELVLLDLMLPGLDGLETCRRLKTSPRTSQVPVIIVTAKGEETDVVSGLEIGADDYVPKPFSPRVLLARVKAVLRRGSTPPPADEDMLRVKQLEIHPGKHEVYLEGQPVQLTLTEYRILWMLARRPGWVFTRRQIVGAVMGADVSVTQRTIDVHVAALRRKLGEAGNEIQTVRGVGYRLKDD